GRANSIHRDARKAVAHQRALGQGEGDEAEHRRQRSVSNSAAKSVGSSMLHGLPPYARGADEKICAAPSVRGSLSRHVRDLPSTLDYLKCLRPTCAYTHMLQVEQGQPRFDSEAEIDA